MPNAPLELRLRRTKREGFRDPTERRPRARRDDKQTPTPASDARAQIKAVCSLRDTGLRLDTDGAAVLARIIDWAEAQFLELGRRDARYLAHALIAGIQGAALLANTFRDPDILTRQTRHLERWIDSL